jgi:hypothetical protein
MEEEIMKTEIWLRNDWRDNVDINELAANEIAGVFKLLILGCIIITIICAGFCI